MDETMIANENLYLGVNANFNSYSQTSGGKWKDFHHAYIERTRFRLNSDLLPMGYEARLESGLKIQDVDPDTGYVGRPRYPEPDIQVWDRQPDRLMPEHTEMPAVPGSVNITPAEALSMDEEEYDVRIGIYKVTNLESDEGETPIVSIEIVSPGNKPRELDKYPGPDAPDPDRPGRDTHWLQFRDKSIGDIKAGQTLILIDLVHEGLPINSVLGDYSPQHPHFDPDRQAAPYSLTVIHKPDADYPQGISQLNPFGVDDPFPKIAIPLAHGQFLADFDFGVPYNDAIRDNYAHRIDYSLPPRRMNTYRVEDQERIAARLLTLMDISVKEGSLKGVTEPPSLRYPVKNAPWLLEQVLKASEPPLPDQPSVDDASSTTPPSPDLDL